jgi:HEAT repeat protein
MELIFAVIEGGRQAHDWAVELGDERLWMRQQAAAHLAGAAEEARAAVSPLAEALADRDPQVRYCAAQALAGVGTAALDALLRALGHRRAVAREWAVVLLGRLGPAARAAREALEQAAGDQEWAVRRAAAQVLDELDCDLGGAAPAGR